MAATATPYGFLPIGSIHSNVYTGGTMRAYRLTADNTVAIYLGGLVTIAAGAINGVGVAPAAGTLSTNSPIGISMGVSYTDPTLKYSLNGQYLPVNCITAGYTNVTVYVVDDPDVLMQVQANTTVTQASIGLNANIIFASTTIPGSSVTGKSSTVIGSIATTNTLPVRIVDLVNQSSIFGGGLSAPGDALTDCIVKWNLNTHAWSFQTGQ